MGFETSKFGDGGYAASTNVTSDVHNHYGARDTGKTQGHIQTEGSVRNLSLDIDGEMVGNEAFPLIAPVLPAGAIITEAYVEVEEAFVLGGTSPTILVGTETSEATNGLVISEAQAEAVGTYDVTSTLTGTWGAPLAAATTLGIDLGGTSPTVTTAGKLRLVVLYVQI